MLVLLLLKIDSGIVLVLACGCRSLGFLMLFGLVAQIAHFLGVTVKFCPVCGLEAGLAVTDRVDDLVVEDLLLLVQAGVLSTLHAPLRLARAAQISV